MSHNPTASITQRPLCPKGPDWTNIWIEEAEDVTIRPAAQVMAEVSNEKVASSLGSVTRNVWIEEEENLTVRPLPPDTFVDDRSTLG